MVLLYSVIAVVVFLAMVGAVVVTAFSHLRRADGSRYFGSPGFTDRSGLEDWCHTDLLDSHDADSSFDADFD